MMATVTRLADQRPIHDLGELMLKVLWVESALDPFLFNLTAFL
jgi:hypothetical protein